MVLNYIWIAFFILAFVFALGETIFNGNIDIWTQIMTSSFDSAKTAFELSIGLTGVLALWMGIMKIGELGGVIPFFGRLVSPLFSRLFPGIPKDHPLDIHEFLGQHARTGQCGHSARTEGDAAHAGA